MRIDLVALTALLLLVIGCGTVAPGSDGGGADAVAPSSDGGADAVVTNSDGGPDAAVDAAPDVSTATCTYYTGDAGQALCNDLPAGALLNMGCPSSPILPQGGTLVDGLYDLVQVDWDTTAGPCPTGLPKEGATIELCSGAFLWLNFDQPLTYGRLTATVQASGTSLHVQSFCPDTSQSYTFGYTATGTQFILFFDNQNGGHFIETFTRQ